ncbi:MAG: FAD-dependent oxidoreductase [Herpetosiphonaceae bacterium]|nr:FAD-dependent oxidoreductase [Herpetosiphonaceae bacterium]
MASERVLIVGGVAAGTSAAAKAKRTNPELDITLYQREPFISYSACGLPYFIGGWVPDHNALIARTPDQFARDGITVRTEHEVLDVDAAAGRITVRDLSSGKTFHDHYDHLVLATGAGVRCPPLPGIDLKGVFRLRSMGDGLAIKQYLAERKPASAVVIGAGYIGIEMAEAFLELGIKTTVIDMLDQVLGTVDVEMAALIETAMREAGIQIHLGAKLAHLDGDAAGQVTCACSTGAELAGEIVLLATGVTPHNELARAAGVALGPREAMLIDGLGRTNVARIYGAGDCCTVNHRVLDQPVYIPLGTTANKQGRTLGAFLGGVERPFAGVVGSSVTKFGALQIASTGMSETMARRAGYAVRSQRIESTDHAGYYPNARPMHVKLVSDAASGKLLGGQIVGYEEVAKRVDILAVALATGMTVEELAWSDLTYAPPVSSVWDPVLVAAQALAKSR